MSTEELLRPRYKVIARWPGMELEPFRLGEIVTLQPHKDDEGDCFIHIPNKHIPGSYMREGFFTNYPHLFRKLEWWEGMAIEEMPEYVKWESGKVTKVIRWKDGCGFCKVIDHTYFVSSNFFTPATLQDYEQYLSQHKHL